MYDIKYFFLNKNNQAIYGAKKIKGGQITKALSKNIIF
jgi:hypothetical protein